MLRFNVYEDEAGEWRWQMTAANGNIIADSGEGYASRANALRAVRRLKQIARDARVFDVDGNPIPYLAYRGGEDPF